jgi:hypothetical protein
MSILQTFLSRGTALNKVMRAMLLSVVETRPLKFFDDGMMTLILCSFGRSSSSESERFDLLPCARRGPIPLGG